jgi:hypothetical protein
MCPNIKELSVEELNKFAIKKLILEKDEVIKYEIEDYH